MKVLHPGATWKVPALFANDNVALRLAREFANEDGRPPFQIVYGAPACAWAGGRPCRVQRRLSEGELRSYFEAYRDLGIRCALTFTHPRAGERTNDPYSNLLLGLLAEYGGQAIVANNTLARHIRSVHPSVPLVCSNNVAVCAFWDGFDGAGGEAAFYRRLLQTYDEVVVRTEAVLEGGVINELGGMADRCEVLVDQWCVRDCELAMEHIDLQVGLIDRGEGAARGCLWRELHTSEELKRRGTIFVPEEQRSLLVRHGLTKWKLGGRQSGARAFAKRTLGAIYGERQMRDALASRGQMSLGLWMLMLADPTDDKTLTRLPTSSP